MNAAWIEYVLFCAAMGIEPAMWRSGTPDFSSQRRSSEPDTCYNSAPEIEMT
jgi:hypothetical protein